VADVFRRHGKAYRKSRSLPRDHLRVMRAIEACRTAALGGHVERCGHCQHQRVSYNSCRNRHCPKCQTTARRQWVEKRKGELLPVEYFHVVFTIPEELNGLALQNPRVLCQILFDTSARTLETIAADPKHLGARIGFFSILHTWGQNLLYHPHVHCVATGGGLSLDGKRWISSPPGFFLSVRVLSRLFRRLFIEALEHAYGTRQLEFYGECAELKSGLPALAAELGKREWVVYAKPPFGGPRQVIEYLGRYTHRVAISNHRLREITDDRVTFDYKDYRSKAPHKKRMMTLTPEEFIRRFLLHTIPSGFQRIRHYGLLASRGKKARLESCRALLDVVGLLPSPEQIAAAVRIDIDAAIRCPVCGIGEMVRIEVIPAMYCSRPVPKDSS
jgi:hypothetical protein